MLELITFIIVFAVIFYLFNKIDSLKSMLGTRVAPTQQLEFNLSDAIYNNPLVLSLAGLSKAQYKEEYDKWPSDRKKRWEDLLKSKNSNLEWEDLFFNLTYLSHDDVFIIEAFSDSKKVTWTTLNRSPNNTYLFDQSLVYYPNKDSESRNEHIRLEVRLRKEKGYSFITVGLREFQDKKVGRSEYMKIFDFPFAKNGSSSLGENEYEEFDFKVEKSSPWVDKDDFGKYVEHPWDTQLKFIHKSGAIITSQN